MTRHLPLVLPTALVAGLVAGVRGVPVATTLAACALAVMGAVAAWRAGRVGAVVAALAVACACAGAAWTAVRVAAEVPAPPPAAGRASGTVVVTGTASTSPTGTRVPVQAIALSGPGAPAPGTRMLMDLPRPAARAPGVPAPGAVVRVTGATSPAARAGSPQWWRAWLRRQGIAVRLSAASWAHAGWRGGPWGLRDALRRFAQGNVAAGLSGDREALVRGMALGGGQGLSEAATRRMRDSGLWHLLAVSGQNVAVIGIGVMAALSAAGVGRRRRVAAAGAVMLAYCAACDGGASVLRAGLMGAIGVAADLRGGRKAPWNALLVALACMLIIDPLAIGDPGLQLSFAAVAGLFAIAPVASQWLRGLMPGRAADLMGQSAGAGLATAPVLALGFGSVSVVGLLANLVAVPVAGPVVVMAMLGVAGSALWAPLGVALAWVAALGASLIMGVATLASAIPGAVQAVPPWGALPLAAVAAAPPVAWRWLRRVPRRGVRGATARAPAPGPPWRRQVAWAIACSCIIAWGLVGGLPGCGAPPPAGPGLRMLDVGQGAAVALRDGARVEVLVDAGPPGDPPPVRAALDRMGAGSVGTLVLSHGSADHAGGAMSVLGDMPVGRVVLPLGDRAAPLVRSAQVQARRRGIPVTWASAGLGLGAGAWDVQVIGPVDDAAAGPPAADANLRCMVVLARARGLHALLPGDAESPVLQRLALPAVDVLQVPHHGSEDPGLADVVRRTSPHVALVSAGQGNAFGHPRAQALGAAASGGARVLRTDRGGDIDVRPGAGGVVIARG